MCKFKSAIILKDRVFVPDYDSHTEMLEELGIADTRANAERLFVRAELIPKNYDVFSDVSEWRFNVDQDITPDWFVAEYEKERMIEAVKAWAKNRIFIGCDDLVLRDGKSFYIKNCKNVSCENSTVTAWGNSTVTAWGNSTVTAWENSTVTAWGNSTVTARENSTVTAWENSTVTACENSTVTAWGNSTVTAWGNSTVTARENSTVTACENSTVTAWGNSTVTARENSTVTARENSTVTARENSTVIRDIWSSFNTDRLVLSDNSTFKDCVTRTLYQSGDFKLVTVTDGKIGG